MLKTLLLATVMTPSIKPPVHVSVPFNTNVPLSAPLTSCRLGTVNSPLIVVLPPSATAPLLLREAALAKVMLLRSSTAPLDAVKVPLALLLPPPLMASVPLWTWIVPVLLNTTLTSSAVAPALPDLRNVPKLSKSVVPPFSPPTKVSSLCAFHKP